MFPLFFRLGPVYIAEIIFMVTGVLEILVKQLFPCYGYTFVELSLQLFLIEMIIVFRLVNKNKQLKIKYISKVIFGTQDYYRKVLYWNNFCVMSVIVGLAYWMIREGLNLSDSQMKDSQKIFTLYPLCFLSDKSNHKLSSEDLRMIMNFMYACNVIMNMFLIAVNIRSLYLYNQRINRNRKFFSINFIKAFQSLIDCHIVKQSIRQRLISRHQPEDMDCGICLRKFCEQSIIKLRCSHFFHSQCLFKWLQIKDQCPYRCI